MRAGGHIFGSWAARRAGVPYITSRRELGEIYPWYKLRWMGWADHRAKAVVVNAEAIRGEILKKVPRPDQICLVPNVLFTGEVMETRPVEPGDGSGSWFPG